MDSARGNNNCSTQGRTSDRHSVQRPRMERSLRARKPTAKAAAPAKSVQKPRSVVSNRTAHAKRAPKRARESNHSDASNDFAAAGVGMEVPEPEAMETAAAKRKRLADEKRRQREALRERVLEQKAAEKEQKRLKKLEKARAAEQEKEARQAEKQAKQREKEAERRAKSAREQEAALEKERAEEERQFQLMLDAMAPSDLDGKTTHAAAFLALVRVAADDMAAATTTPQRLRPPLLQLTRMSDTAPALLELMELWRQQYAEAWQAASQQAEVAQKRVRFLAALGPSAQAMLFSAAQCVWADVPRDMLGSLLFALQRCVRERYITLNMPPAPAHEPATVDALTVPERGLVKYLAGWAVRSSLAYAERHAKALLPVLQQLVEPARERPAAAADPIDVYLESRELYGGLLRVCTEAALAFETVEAELRTALTKENLLFLRDAVLAHAATRVTQSAAVNNAFASLLVGGSETDMRTAQKHLTTRYLHMRAKAFRKEVMQAIDAHKKGMAVRTLLKATMIAAHAGKEKKGRAISSGGARRRVTIFGP